MKGNRHPLARRAIVLLAFAAAAAAKQGYDLVFPVPLAAQTTAARETVETEPIRCWWRTSVPAVRIGEPFTIVLTCAVVETETVTVVPNQTELAPNAVQLPPFDVIGGSQGDDLRTPDRRFFQYEYQARLISPDLFGKDVKLPEMRISYKIRTRVDGETLEGRDLLYLLPDTSVRVLSLVPADAADIRDATRETFTDVERRVSRANLLQVGGGILMAFAVLAALVGVTRAVGGSSRKAPAARTLASDAAILRQAGRELSDLERARREEDWNPALTARLLTVLRILAAYALGAPPSATAPDTSRAAAAPSGAKTADGAMTLRGRGLRAADVAVPGWVTPVAIAEELKRAPGGDHPRAAVLQPLHEALSRITALQYARDAASPDAAVDGALEAASSALRQLKIDNLWIVRKGRTLADRAGLTGRAWSR
jgi:hypothetical protein